MTNWALSSVHNSFDFTSHQAIVIVVPVAWRYFMTKSWDCTFHGIHQDIPSNTTCLYSRWPKRRWAEGQLTEKKAQSVYIRQSCKFFCSANRVFSAYFPYIFALNLIARLIWKALVMTVDFYFSLNGGEITQLRITNPPLTGQIKTKQIAAKFIHSLARPNTRIRI